MDITILWKGVLGGVVTGLIVWASTRGDVLPGIIPLFPTFTLIALTAAGIKGDPKGFQQTCLAAVKTLPALGAFVLVSYFLIDRLNFRLTLVVALAVWLLVVLCMFGLPKILARVPWHLL